MPLFAALDRLKTDLDALRPLAPEQEQRVLQKFRLEWNYNSNAIEGNSLTLGETRSLLLHGLTAAGKPMRDHLDIKGHNEAVLWLEDFVRDERPLTEQFIRGMHEVLLGDAYYAPAQTATGQPTRKMIVPGQYKQQPNNVLTATGEMFYFANPEDTPIQMAELVQWYRQEDAAPTMHPVALAAEFHYRFVRIHPFGDGNGRMSRLLMNLILMRRGYAITVIKAADRNRYLAALSDADAGDFEPFLRFIIENVEASLQLMIRAAKGESIDEPDDLDKKLALLKKQVLSRDNYPTSEWNAETQYDHYGSLLIFWCEDLAGQLNRFDFAFSSKECSLQILRINGLKEATGPRSYDETMDALETSADNPVLINILQFAIDWKTFKKPPYFNVSLGICFEFTRSSFRVFYKLTRSVREIKSVSLTEDNKVFESIYKSAYDESKITKINYQLANKVYDFIATKVAEADSSPS